MCFKCVLQTLCHHSIQFSCSVMSDSLWPHEPQYTRPPYPSPTAGVYRNPSPLSRWCRPTIISSSVVPSPLALNLSQHQGLFQWVSSSHQVAKVLEFSASASVFPMNTQDWSPLGWTGWISLQSKGLSRVFSNTTVQRNQFFSSVFFIVQLSHLYMTTGKTIALTRLTFVDKIMSLLLNMMSKLVITFLPRSKHLLISWLQSPSGVVSEPPK